MGLKNIIYKSQIEVKKMKNISAFLGICAIQPLYSAPTYQITADPFGSVRTTADTLMFDRTTEDNRIFFPYTTGAPVEEIIDQTTAAFVPVGAFFTTSSSVDVFDMTTDSPPDMAIITTRAPVEEIMEECEFWCSTKKFFSKIGEFFVNLFD